MTPARSKAAHELLRRLLEGYERSRAYGRPAPWPRDVLVRIDAGTFPDAFAPDGRELLAGLRAAAEDLARVGAARVERAAGWADGEPRMLRLGPEELERAYALAAEAGFEPLATALAQTAAHADRLREGTTPWMAGYLERVARGVDLGDLSPLGMQVERFKRDWREVVHAMTAAARLALGVSGWERVVSEAIFGASKRLGELRVRVADLLTRADPRWLAWAPDDAQDVLEVYGVRRKPGLIVCAGRVSLSVGGRRYALEDFTPVAHLPASWSGAWIEAMAAAGITQLTTIENEVPFLAYVEESGGPRGLGERGEVAVYSGGFPTPALVQTLAEVCRVNPRLALRHWGDADVGGLRIWWYLRQRVERSIDFYRVDRAWLDLEVGRRGGTPLGAGERAALRDLRRELDRGSLGSIADVAQALNLIDGLLHHGVKIEQERS